jgi:hypothetical protein
MLEGPSREKLLHLMGQPARGPELLSIGAGTSPTGWAVFSGNLSSYPRRVSPSFGTVRNWCGRNAGMRSPPSNKVSPQLVCTFTASYDSLTAFHISHDYTNLCHDITTCSNQLQKIFYSDSAIKPLQLSTQLVIVIRMLLWLNITTMIYKF